MATPVTEYESSWSSTTSPKTSSSLSVQAGDVLAVVASGSLNLTCSDSQGLSWTLRQSIVVTNYEPLWLWTATVAATGSLTVTVTRSSGSSNYGLDVTVWRGVTVGASSKTNATGAPSLGITTTAANSAIVVASSDWAGVTSSRTWRTGAGAATELWDVTSGSTRFYGAYHADAGTQAAKTVGLSAPSGQTYSIVALELVTTTPTAGVDTVALGVTDAATVGVIAAKAGTDTAALGLTESTSLAAVVSRTDTVDLGVTDVRTLAATSSRTDTVALGLSDSATLSISNAVAAADTVALGVADKASVRRAASRADLASPWDLAGQWPTIIRSEAWERAVSARVRTLAGWVELVDPAGNPVQVQTDEGPRWRLPASGASVTWRDQMGGYSGQLTFADPWMIPTASRHPLWGASGLRARVWWAVWSSEMAAWLCKPVATLAIGDTDADDTGTISGRVSGRDVLATMQGYGGSGAPDVVGMTVSAALGRIFARSAPTLAVTIAPSSEIIPEGTTLRDPATDVVELAEMGYPLGAVRSDCLGAVHVGPRQAPADEPLDWQEGHGCPVSRIKWKHGVEAMGNHVRAVSTHPDAVGLYVVREDDDPTSPTWVGGPWGVHPLPQVESSIAVTVEALAAAADAVLDRGLHPTEDVEVDVPQRPDMDGRTVRLTREQLGVAGVLTPASWSLSLPVAGEAPGLMSVGMMQRTV